MENNWQCKCGHIHSKELIFCGHCGRGADWVAPKPEEIKIIEDTMKQGLPKDPIKIEAESHPEGITVVTEDQLIAALRKAAWRTREGGPVVVYPDEVLHELFGKEISHKVFIEGELE